jgi:transcriptional regulator with XRE-family HTH domain
MEQERRAREVLVARLRDERAELEQAVAARVRAIADPQEPRDPIYLEGRQAAVGAAVDYGLSGIEQGDRVQLPPILLAQARLAARFGVSLETVLRRYFAGYTLFCDFTAEASRTVNHPHLREILRSQAQLFDRLLAEVTEEYRREPPRLLSSSEERRAEQVGKILAGELADLDRLGYELKGWHVAAIAPDVASTEALREVATALDRRILEVRQQDGQIWIWFGGRREPDMAELLDALSQSPREQTYLALGEPGVGISGWRLSHRQARAVWSAGHREGRGLTRYADVALLASMLRDELLVTSLHRLFIEPLEAERDGTGKVLKETLKAYFAAGRNVSSAASALKVTRQTVANRLRAVEASLGRSLLQCGLELEAALLLENDIEA